MKRIVLVSGLAAVLTACGSEMRPPSEQIPALSLKTTALPNGRIGQSYDQKLEVTGGTAPYKFALVQGALPEGLELKATTGQITGIAGAPGTFSFKVEVSDAAPTPAMKVARDLTLYVTPDPLVIVTSSTLAMGQEGKPYQVMLTARGGVAPLSFSLESGTLPSGLALDPSGGLSGTPGQFGRFDFRVRVTDKEGGMADKRMHLFLASLSPMISTSTVPKGRLGAPYQVHLEADGGTPPFTWAAAGGRLPMGLALASDGSLEGTPGESGTFTVEVRVTDAAQRTDTTQYALRVIAPLLIETRAIPQLILRRPVSFQLEASGGVPPYVWRIGSGMLPAGLTLSQEGLLTGTVTGVTEEMVTVRVQDAEGFLKSALFTVRVSDRFTYEASPMTAFPPVCTATAASYASADLIVAESMQVQDLSIAVDVDFADSAAPSREGNRKLKLVLWAPDGRRATLCGGGAGIRGVTGCDGSGGVHTTFDDQTMAEVPLTIFRGMNPQGTWRLSAVVTQPSRQGTACRQEGTINHVTLSIRDDRSPDPYVVVGGFTRNNLINEPWVRISGGRAVPENELFLSATAWGVGPNGYREGGKGDDVPDMSALTWTFSGPPSIATVTPDGHVTAGRQTGQGNLVAAGAGGLMYRAVLRVFPPDWNPAVRQNVE